MSGPTPVRPGFLLSEMHADVGVAGRLLAARDGR
jgi:hypothetical protein